MVATAAAYSSSIQVDDMVQTPIVEKRGSAISSTNVDVSPKAATIDVPPGNGAQIEAVPVGTIDKEDRGKYAVVVVDPSLAEASFSRKVILEGFRCIFVFSSRDSPLKHALNKAAALDFSAEMELNSSAEDSEAALSDLLSALMAQPWPIVAAFAGGEAGATLADTLAARLGVAGNGEEASQCLRDQYLAAERVRSKGLRALRQAKATIPEDLDAFLRDWNSAPFSAVVKPLERTGGTGGGAVLCDSPDGVREAFAAAVNGEAIAGKLIQEHLDGTEYAVDSVSRDGVHRVCAIWQYHKESINGASQVPLGMKLTPSKDGEGKEVVDFAVSVLDAVGLKHGPSHVRVIYTSTGPCLVEVSSRCHGPEGEWTAVADKCLGYNQVDVAYCSYLEPAAWEATPMRPDGLEKAGRIAFLAARESGVFRGAPGIEEVKALDSYAGMEVSAKAGDFVFRTTDRYTSPGWVGFVHELEYTVEKDYQRIRGLEEEGMFDFEVICPEPPTRQRAVVVVDPFSAGAVLALRVMEHGLALITVMAELESAMAIYVQRGIEIAPKAVIYHDDTMEDQEAALQKTLKALRELPYSIVAIMAGAETGVAFSDLLSSRFGTRTNGTEKTLQRRNKYHMSEQVRKCGARAAWQSIVQSVADVDSVLDAWNPTAPWKAVIKPVDSCGTDTVFLVESREEARKAYEIIDGNVNYLGGINEGALLMEYLDGDEYVIDGVSRDGQHRICAVWKYDKRTVNGANFVYFGAELRTVEGKVESEIVAYAEKVLDALGFKHGPSHMEVKYTSSGPCLVEVGGRCHGGEGTWTPLVQECVGYNQVDATLYSYVMPDEFEKIPVYPTKLMKGGNRVFLVSKHEGRVVSVPGAEIIEALPSTRTVQIKAQAGYSLPKTIDCSTRAGTVQLANEDLEQLKADYTRIRELEDDGLYELISEEDSVPQAMLPKDECVFPLGVKEGSVPSTDDTSEGSASADS